MAPRLSEFGSQADADSMCQRNGFDHSNGRTVQQLAVLGGKVQIRVDGGVCPPDQLHSLEFDPETGFVRGWQPGGTMFIHLPPMDEDGWPALPAEPDQGAPCEFNLSQLRRHLQELRANEAPVHRPNAGGRPEKYNWGAAMIALGAHMLQAKTPSSPARFAAFLRDWFAQQSAGGGPDDRLIREWAKKAYAAWIDRP